MKSLRLTDMSGHALCDGFELNAGEGSELPGTAATPGPQAETREPGPPLHEPGHRIVQNRAPTPAMDALRLTCRCSCGAVTRTDSDWEWGATIDICDRCGGHSLVPIRGLRQYRQRERLAEAMAPGPPFRGKINRRGRRGLTVFRRGPSDA